jgi:hypothetical protein
VWNIFFCFSKHSLRRDSPLAFIFEGGEGPKRRTREGGSEWEPIKILFRNSAYEPDFTRAPPQACRAKFT